MPSTNPFGCSFAAMAQRGANEVVLLDTGSYPGFSNYLNSTWGWDGVNWNKASEGLDGYGPVPLRADFGLSYDGYNVVMFGGRPEAGEPLNDTWSWNGTAWSKKAPSTVPSARYKHKLAHLASSTPKAVMFGGTTVLGMTDDTWVWNGHSGTLNWVKANSTFNPAPRIDHAFAGNDGYCALFGGKTTATLLGDTWLFNGTQWLQYSPAGAPGPRAECAMAYDVANSEWVLFGGRTDTEVLGETYTLNATVTTWTKEAPAASPSPRVGAQMCYDSLVGAVLLFGGTNGYETFNDTWKWTGTNWVKL
jgi:hypothetical protein